jgi:hypothetical protein
LCRPSFTVTSPVGVALLFAGFAHALFEFFPLTLFISSSHEPFVYPINVSNRFDYGL